MVFPAGEVSYVPAARAAAGTVRDLHELCEVRAVVADAVQRRRVQVWHLADELAAGPARGASCFRAVLTEIADGIRSVAEADLRTLIQREGLPGGWERTLARDAQMSAFGIVVLHFPPRRLRTEPRAVAAEIRSALAAGRDRSGHDIRALPSN